MEYLVRPARITDIDRLGALCAESGAVAGSGTPLDAADLLRQLVYLPHASVFVAEAHKEVVGGAVLALRPSIQAGGFVGTVDFLVVARGHDPDRVSDALIEEIVRSARNKGCAAVEVMLPADPAVRGRWERNGFTEAGASIYRAGVATRAAANR